jgi:glycosyltransferase involved in cell wall biosynthesis
MESSSADLVGADVVERLAGLAAESGIRRISVLAWRDLDDPEAGGSEVHVARVISLWADAGIDVTMRTSHAPGHPQVVWRDGYRVIRKAGRYLVFPRAVFSETMRWHGERDALVEIWNGMPWFSPVWADVPRCVWLHHVHDTMWEMTLPPRLAKFGRALEFKIAPPFYRRTEIVTLSESSRRELEEKLHLKPKRIHVVPVGIDSQYSPGGAKSPDPLVVAVGRLVAVKRFGVLVDALLQTKLQVPALRAVLVGDGYEREELLAQIDKAGASDWLTLAGRVSDREKIDYYRQAWLVASASAHEGWGMTLTEAAACGTPSVATRIAGHEDAVAEGKSGLLADDDAALVPAMVSILNDASVRDRLSAGALEHAARFTWGATALGTLEVLAADARRRRGS